MKNIYVTKNWNNRGCRPYGEKVAYIRITPKLGPYGSGTRHVEVSVVIDLEGVTDQDREKFLNKTFTINLGRTGRDPPKLSLVEQKE